jgi:hypothetical protein
MVMTEAAAANKNTLHQPARDNAGNVTPPLEAHTQRPDPAPSARPGWIGRDAFEALPLDQRDRYTAVRAGPDGGTSYVPRDQSVGDSNAKPDASAGEKHKFGEMEFTEQELRDFLTARGEAELRKASLPQNPSDYRAELPANFEMPAGVEFKIDETDPLLLDARAWAHSKGFSQADFSELVGIYATAKGKEASLYNRAATAEVAKLGANGAQRVTALETWMRGMVGDELAGAMRGMLVTEKIVRGWETIQRKFSSQGAAPFTQAHREPGQVNGKVSESEYAAMGPAERLSYARSHDQSQFTNTR